jgi:hypothetical protein
MIQVLDRACVCELSLTPTIIVAGTL